MKILFIANYSQLYGANRSMMTIIEYLHNKGYNVKLILPSKGDICQELDKIGIEYKVIPMFTQLYYVKCNFKYLALLFLDIWTFFKFPILIKEAKKFLPDIIYSNTSAEMTGIKVAKKLGVKHISHIREFMDLDHGAQFILGRKGKKRFINQSDGVIYVSNSVANHVNLGEPLIQNQRVIYNGIKDTNVEFENKEICGFLNLGIVGILDKAKGQDLAINAMPNILKIFPNAKLNIWGDKECSFKRIIHKLIKSLNLENSVVLHGFEKNSDKIYRDMDVLLMCSRCEGFGRVTVEAMQRGIPVIGLNTGGTSELIKDGFNGYLFNSIQEIPSKLSLLLESEEHYNRIRRNAYIDSRSLYSVAQYCKSVEDFICQIYSS